MLLMRRHDFGGDSAILSAYNKYTPEHIEPVLQKSIDNSHLTIATGRYNNTIR